MHDKETGPTEEDQLEDVDANAAADEPSLTEYDKTIADSFPASDPPTQP